MLFLLQLELKRLAITDGKPYVPVVTLSTQDNKKLLHQLKLEFKRKINWDKYQSKETKLPRNQYLNFLIDACFQVLNRLFVLPFDNSGDQAGSYHNISSWILFSKSRNKKIAK